MRFASVCSGIEAPSLAWKPMGWEAAFFSEIESFPGAVLRLRHPETPNYGDMLQLRSKPEVQNETGRIDLLVGGTPCQSFSVAGDRGGLDDPRGQLAFEFLRLVQLLRSRWVVWENVPGVLSADGGRAFGAFLRALEKLGYGWAYRVLDAQYFGVPQRRRRVFVVGYLGDWRGPGAVLFERESLQRNSPPRREKGKEIAGTIGGSSQSGGFRTTDLDNSGAFIPEVARSLLAHASRNDADSDTFVFDTTQITHRENRSKVEAGGPAPALAASAHAPTIAFGCKDRDPASTVGEVSPTLRAMGGARANGGGQVAIAFEPRIARGRGYATEGADGSLTSEADRGDGHPCVTVLNRVRRLTPRECERLMGIPDDYTAIPWGRKAAVDCPDGPRYKSIGNSIAVPVLDWLGRRIEFVDNLKQKGN